ncbi:MAG: molybdopterin oxidoreductase [Deltaproteobacteria bacterium]|nr:MAG: molybdopterin oxidoreductase [Deltaproteobacteria bacterium]RLC19170.1 MAG: molybdopterin oxidoreductase [Deltaproteobacteria bacterium]
MSRDNEMKALLEQTRFSINDRLQKLLLFFIVIGIVGFVAGLIGNRAHQAWQALLVNTLFFSGIALGGLAFSVIFTITSAQWGRPIKRLAEALSVFLPIGALLLCLLFFGANHFFEWMDHDKVIHAKEGWLNFPFFIIRNVVFLGVFIAVGGYYLKTVIRPDIGLAGTLGDFRNTFTDRFVKNYGSQKKEEAVAEKRAKILAPLLALLFFFFCTLLAFDWMMSIDQEWFSTMFGVQYAISNLIGAAAVLLIVAGIARRNFNLDDYITIERYHDLAKLTFAFCALWTYLIFSQVLVIWYGNLPEETPYLILRMQSVEWGWMFWFILILLFIIPFFGLMSRTACNSIWFSRLIAVDVLVGLWLEKYFLIVPSIQENQASAGLIDASGGLPGFVPNIFDVSITLGVLGIFLLSYFWFLQRVPAVPISDALFLRNPTDH